MPVDFLKTASVLAELLCGVDLLGECLLSSHVAFSGFAYWRSVLLFGALYWIIVRGVKADELWELQELLWSRVTVFREREIASRKEGFAYEPSPFLREA